MNSDTKEKPKDRIVSVSAKLFSGHGINTVGVDKICIEADVSKRTLYKHFSSKEALVSAAVTKIAREWFEACANAESGDPEQRIRHVFTMIEPMAKVKDFYGCILMNTSIELRGGDDLAIEVARDFKGRLYDYFRQQAVLLGAKEPDEFAQQLVLLFDGANAWIVLRREFPSSVFRSLDMLLHAHA